MRSRAAAATCWPRCAATASCSRCRTRWASSALALFTYASFLALRGLWLGPLLIERHGFSLVQSGNVALRCRWSACSAPPLFGRLDPGDARAAPLDHRLHAGLRRALRR